MSNTRELIKRFGGATHSLGQHFLLSEPVVERMVEKAEITKEDTVIEIGPGLGILTKKLNSSPAKMIIACEKDRKLYEFLLGECKNKKLKLICDDALLLIPQLQVESPFKVVANLPYNISSPVMISLLTICPTLPKTMVLMLQKEVAERICAKPNSSNRGFLTVLLELMGEPEIIETVPSNLFYPEPAVQSATILISNIEKPNFDIRSAMKIIKLSFAGKRKKLKNSLFSSLQLKGEKAEQAAKRSGVTLDMRPEDLNKKQWEGLILELSPLLKRSY